MMPSDALAQRRIFERNLDSGSLLGLERGLNRSWQNGGLFMPPQLR